VFARTLSTEMLQITSQLAMQAQTLFETMDRVFAPSPARAVASSSAWRGGSTSGSRRFVTGHAAQHKSQWAAQPRTAREGFRMAVDSLAQGMQSAASSVVVIPADEYERAGLPAMLRSVISAAPRVLLRPLAGTSQALARAALGLRNEIAPQRAHESQDKYMDAAM